MNKKKDDKISKINRESEVEWIKKQIDAWKHQDSANKKPLMILLRGEYGVGKTTIINEFNKSHKNYVNIKNKLDINLVGNNDMKNNKHFFHIKLWEKLIWITTNFWYITLQYLKFLLPLLTLYYSILIFMLTSNIYGDWKKPILIPLSLLFIPTLFILILWACQWVKLRFFSKNHCRTLWIENINLLSKENMQENFIPWFWKLFWLYGQKYGKKFIFFIENNDLKDPLNYFFWEKFEPRILDVYPNRSYFIEKINRLAISLINELGDDELIKIQLTQHKKLMEHKINILTNLLSLFTNRMFENMIVAFSSSFDSLKGEINVIDFVLNYYFKQTKNMNEADFWKILMKNLFINNSIHTTPNENKEIKNLKSNLEKIENNLVRKIIEERGFKCIEKQFTSNFELDIYYNGIDTKLTHQNYIMSYNNDYLIYDWYIKIRDHPIEFLKNAVFVQGLFNASTHAQLYLEYLSNEKCIDILEKILKEKNLEINYENRSIFNWDPLRRLVYLIIESRKENWVEFIQSIDYEFLRFVCFESVFRSHKKNYVEDQNEFNELIELFRLRKINNLFGNYIFHYQNLYSDNQAKNIINKKNFLNYNKYINWLIDNNSIYIINRLFFMTSTVGINKFSGFALFKSWLSINKISQNTVEKLISYLQKNNPNKLPIFTTENQEIQTIYYKGEQEEIEIRNMYEKIKI